MSTHVVAMPVRHADGDGSAAGRTGGAVLRDRLVAAMRRLAGQQGPADVTVAQLCAAVGTTPATFARLFDDVDDLFATVVERELGAFEARVSGAARAAGPARSPARARAAVRTFFAELAADPTTAWLCAIEPAGTNRRARAARAAASGRIAALLGPVAASGGATAPVDALWELAYQHLIGHGDARSLAAVAEPAIHLILRPRSEDAGTEGPTR